jgi:cytochrome b561
MMLMTAAIMAIIALAANELQTSSCPFDTWLNRFYKSVCFAAALVTIIDTVWRWMKKPPAPIPGPQGLASVEGSSGSHGPAGRDGLSGPQGQNEQEGQKRGKVGRGK